jgi:hypothetical protein
LHLALGAAIIHPVDVNHSSPEASIAMRISANLSALALRQLIGGACSAVGVAPGESAIEGVVGFLTRHFIDHSQRISEALRHTNERAWKALEVALAGESLWDRCKLMLASGEDKAFREQVRPFLDACPLAELQGKSNCGPRARRDCSPRERWSPPLSPVKPGPSPASPIPRRCSTRRPTPSAR